MKLLRLVEVEVPLFTADSGWLAMLADEGFDLAFSATPMTGMELDELEAARMSAARDLR